MKNLRNVSSLGRPFIVMLVLLVLTGCTPALSTATDPSAVSSLTLEAQPAGREALVHNVEIQIMNTHPAQISAVVSGYLTESCAMLGESQVKYESNTFQIIIYAVSPSDVGCLQVTTPFVTTIPLNTKDLSNGTYIVVANGVRAIFTLPVEDSTPSPEPGAALAPPGQACVDSALFMGDITIPDNTIVTSNTAFTKTWRLKNTGTCTWDSTYLVAYISGTTMSQQPGYWIVPQGQTVSPDQTVDVSVGMTSPIENGNYVSYWGLKKPDGQFMPIQGSVGGNSFYIKIKISNGGSNTGSITAASINIEREEGSGALCSVDATYFVHARITADGPTTAAYEINSTAGQVAAGDFQTSPTDPVSPVVTGTVEFDQAESKAINLRFIGPYPYPDNITVNLRVNGGEWHSAKLSCQ